MIRRREVSEDQVNSLYLYRSMIERLNKELLNAFDFEIAELKRQLSVWLDREQELIKKLNKSYY